MCSTGVAFVTKSTTSPQTHSCRNGPQNQYIFSVAVACFSREHTQQKHNNYGTHPTFCSSLFLSWAERQIFLLRRNLYKIKGWSQKHAVCTINRSKNHLLHNFFVLNSIIHLGVNWSSSIICSHAFHNQCVSLSSYQPHGIFVGEFFSSESLF